MDDDLTFEGHFALDGQHLLELNEYIKRHRRDKTLVLTAFAQLSSLDDWNFPVCGDGVSIKTFQRKSLEWDFTMYGSPKDVKEYLYQVSRDPVVKYIGIKTYLY